RSRCDGFASDCGDTMPTEVESPMCATVAHEVRPAPLATLTAVRPPAAGPTVRCATAARWRFALTAARTPPTGVAPAAARPAPTRSGCAVLAAAALLVPLKAPASAALSTATMSTATIPATIANRCLPRRPRDDDSELRPVRQRISGLRSTSCGGRRT